MTDEFDILGVRPAFDLDAGEIESAYLALAGRLHPDLAMGSDGSPGRMAEINKARRVLSNPESRADVLLRRLGGPAAQAEKSLPEGFLAGILAVREEIESAIESATPHDREARRHVWEDWSRGQRAAAIADVGGLIRSLPKEPEHRREALRQIRVRLNAWRYVERLIEQLDPSPGAGPTG